MTCKTATVKVSLRDAIVEVSYTANGSPFSRLLKAVKDWEDARFDPEIKTWTIETTDLNQFKKHFHEGFFKPSDLEWTELPNKEEGKQSKGLEEIDELLRSSVAGSLPERKASIKTLQEKGIKHFLLVDRKTCGLFISRKEAKEAASKSGPIWEPEIYRIGSSRLLEEISKNVSNFQQVLLYLRNAKKGEYEEVD